MYCEDRTVLFAELQEGRTQGTTHLDVNHGKIKFAGLRLVNKTPTQIFWEPSHFLALSHPSTTIPSQSPQEPAPKPNLLHLFSPRHCNTGSVEQMHDSIRGREQTAPFIFNSFDSSLILVTTPPWRLYLPGREQRQQSIARSSLKQCSALLPEHWGDGYRRDVVNMAKASIPCLEICCILQYCREASAGLNIGMVIPVGSVIHQKQTFTQKLWIKLRLSGLGFVLQARETTQKWKRQPYLLKASHQVPRVQLKNISNDGDWRGTRRLLPSLRCTPPCSNEKAWDTDQQEDCGQSQEVHGGQRKRCQVSEESELGPANLRYL